MPINRLNLKLSFFFNRLNKEKNRKRFSCCTSWHPKLHNLVLKKPPLRPSHKYAFLGDTKRKPTLKLHPKTSLKRGWSGSMFTRKCLPACLPPLPGGVYNFYRKRRGTTTATKFKQFYATHSPVSEEVPEHNRASIVIQFHTGKYFETTIVVTR